MAQAPDIEGIQNSLRIFGGERDWDQFHNPKNLASALVVEAAVLLEIFQWLDPDHAQAVAGSAHSRVAEELDGCDDLLHPHHS